MTLPLEFALFGLVFASFACMAVERLPRRESLFGRSHCEACRGELSAWHVVPLLGYALLRGRCAMCGVRISVMLPVTEVAFAAAFFIAARVAPPAAAAAACALATAMFIGAGVAWRRNGARTA